MDPGPVEALFQPFKRLGAEFRGVEGHGLGLTISRLLARSMLSEITVQIVLGGGSRFTLHLRDPSAAANALDLR